MFPRVRRGFSMIEVLIVIVVMSLGLVGLVALQARAVQFSVGAEDSNRAALLASDIAARMWGAGTVSLPTAEVDAWAARVADAAGPGLPNGVGTVAVAGNVATVTVTWRAPHDPVGSERRYVTQVQM